MKLSRVMEILSVLQEQGSAKAAELAKRFGVSVRTIYRDVATLEESGVPVKMVKGAYGGIFLDPDKKIPVGAGMIGDARRRVSESEAADAIEPAPEPVPVPEPIKEPEPVKEPAAVPEPVPAPAPPRETVQLQPNPARKLRPPEFAGPHDAARVTLVFTPDAEKRVREDFPESAIRKDFDGTLTVERDMTENEELYAYILSYGPSVKVDSPTYIRVIIRERAKKTLAQYEQAEAVPQTSVWGKMKRFLGGDN